MRTLSILGPCLLAGSLLALSPAARGPLPESVAWSGDHHADHGNDVADTGMSKAASHDSKSAKPKSGDAKSNNAQASSRNATSGGEETSDTVPADDALVRLLEGNLRYVASQTSHPDQDAFRRLEVAKSQHPFAVILTCADSRVAPELLFDQGLGSLFVVRVAGNIADDAAIGSIEYAVEHLGARLVMVLGHERCGAVKAALDGGHAPGRIGVLVDAIEPAVARSRGKAGDPLDNAVRSNVRMAVDRLSYAEPILSEAWRAGRIKVVGARYDLDAGTVELLR